jgi:spore germination protein KA/spore germination protein
MMKNADISLRTLQCRGERISILYVQQLTDRHALSEHVIKPLAEYCAGGGKKLDAQSAAGSVIFADDCSVSDDEHGLERHILNGMTVVCFSGDKSYIVINLKQVDHRPVPEPELQYCIRSPRDCFVENIDVNISLLRYRLKDSSLKLEHLTVGQRTRTRVTLLYIGDIANDTCVGEIRKRVNAVDTDGILESGELQAFLMNSKLGIFPEMCAVERSDWAAEMLLEGKVVLLIDGSSLALAAPITFAELMYSCDDRYDNKYMGLFMRLLRITAFFISFSLSSYWVAIIAFHSDILPAGFVIQLAEARARVPFSALVGVLLLEFIVELIRESLVRVPSKIGSAIAIVSAIIIGQASVSAGVFSPLLLILISIEFLASFAVPNQIAVNPLRIIKILLLLITSMFGFYGFILGLTVVVINMVSINSFGVPYIAPFGPFNLHDFLRVFMFSRTTSPKRQQYMRNKDSTRSHRK